MNRSILENPDIRRQSTVISLEAYHYLYQSGLIPEKTELIQGVVINKMPKSPLHTYTVRKIFEFLSHLLSQTGFCVFKEDPLTLTSTGSEPEPDIAVIKGVQSDFISMHPKTAEWVIEVAVSSLEIDREKCADYAAAGIKRYWIVIPDEKSIEVYSEPRDGVYRQKTIMDFFRLQTIQIGDVKLEICLDNIIK